MQDHGRSYVGGISAAPTHRSDIQALRGLAILLVLAHHAHVPFIPGGFLGVDIFFVISGFLMTGIIDDALQAQRFSLADFYRRRVRRLFPAAYATLAVTALLAPFLLDSFELRNFVGQLIGAFTFTANFVLWAQSDYFASAAYLKPLLHTWSLSIEEQFYLFLPVLMLLAPSRSRLWLVAAVALASAILCAIMLSRSPSATFYFLPTRAWELGLGSVVALALRRGLIAPRPMTAARLACAAILVLVPMFADEQGHPGFAAAVVCLATCLLMVPGARGQGHRYYSPLIFFGDRSYSLYLVHWPVFAFANHVFIGTMPRVILPLLVLLCLLWTELQYRLVEQRLRGFTFDTKAIALLLLVPLVSIGSVYGFSRTLTTPDTIARQASDGLSADCDFTDRFTETDACRSGVRADTLVWGDSFAMHLASGLAATNAVGVVQATRTVCGPFVGIAPVNDGSYSRHWAESCVSFNNSVLDYLAHHPEIRFVVLSSALAQYVPGAEDKGWSLLVSKNGGSWIEPQSRERLQASLRHTVGALRAMGKRVVLFAPPPAAGFDIARCLDRTSAGLLTVLDYPRCEFPVTAYKKHRAQLLDFLAGMRTVVPIISLDDFLCGTGSCRTRLEGTMLYRDADHLSDPGSEILAQRMHWSDVVRRSAR